MLGGGIGGFDASASFILFPEVRDTIANGDGAAASWVLTIGGIVGAAVLLQAGRLADRFGHHRLFAAGVSIFTVSCLAAAVAPNLFILVVMRAVQAIGLAVMGPSSVAIIVDSSPEGTHSKSLGTWGAVTAIAGVIAPPTIAVLVEVGSWPAAYLSFALVGVVVAAVSLPGATTGEITPAASEPDLLGAASMMTGLGLLVLGLVEGNGWGWLTARTVGVLVSSMILVGFTVARSRTQGDPVVPLDLLKRRNVFLASIVGLVTAIAFFAHWVVMLALLTDLWGVALLPAALLLSLMPGTMALFATAAGRLIDTVGFRRVMVPGAMVYSLLFLVPVFFIGPERNWFLLVPALIGAGIGMATVWPALTGVGTQHLPSDRLATASAVIHTFLRIGGALGSAIAVAWVAAGTPGATATHRNPIWLLVVGGLLIALGSLGFREGATEVDPKRVVA